MGYQVITDYTEVDPDSRITRYTNYVAFSAWNTIYESYVYRDFGANYFSNIDIYFRLKVTAAVNGNGAQVAHLAFKNTISCIKSGGGLALAVTSYRVSSGNVQIYLASYNGIATDASQGSAGYVTFGSYYYCRLVRPAGSTTATLYIYTDSARTSLWTTLQITHANVATQYQYLYAVAFIMTGYGYGITGETGNITIPTEISGQLPGASVLSATGKMTAKCSGELAGLSTFSAVAKRQLNVAGSLPAIGALGASIQRIMKASGSIDGLTDLYSSLKLINLISGQLPGTSVLSATGKMTAKCSGGLAGLGALSAAAKSQMKASGSLPAIGALDASVQTLMKASGSIDGRTGIWVYKAGDDIFLCNAIIMKCDVRANYRMSAILTDVKYFPPKQVRTQPWAASYIIPPDVNADARRS